MAIERLRRNPNADHNARQTEDRTDVLAGGSEPGRILSGAAGAASGRRGYGSAGRYSGDRTRPSPPLRLPSHRCRAAAKGPAGEPQAGGSMDEGGQPVGYPAAAV